MRFLPEVHIWGKTCNIFLHKSPLLHFTGSLQFHQFSCKQHNFVLFFSLNVPFWWAFVLASGLKYLFLPNKQPTVLIFKAFFWFCSCFSHGHFFSLLLWSLSFSLKTGVTFNSLFIHKYLKVFLLWQVGIPEWISSITQRLWWKEKVIVLTSNT
jgi:hypothetical protein